MAVLEQFPRLITQETLIPWEETLQMESYALGTPHKSFLDLVDL